MCRIVPWSMRIVAASLFLTACSSGGGGGESANSLAGTVLSWYLPFRGNSPFGLPGVVVRVESTTSTDSAQATTDRWGNFIVLDPPTGMVRLHLDATGVETGTFADLELPLIVGGGASNLSQPILLPSLDAGWATVPVDANGVTTGNTVVGDPLFEGLGVDIPEGTTILVSGAPPPGSVDVNITRVEAIDVPLPAVEGTDPGSFATIQPANLAFDPPLAITLPNPRGFPDGELVDIWFFDVDEGAWRNRSEEAGQPATVVDVGGSTVLVASGVVAEGGWYAAALPLDPNCATTLEGQIVEFGPFGFPGPTTPIADALVSLSTGQFARTGADGRFRIPSVPAYDFGIDECVPRELALRVITPVAFAARQVTVGIGPQFVVPGGTTSEPSIGLQVPDTGSVVGFVTEDGEPVEGEVSITGGVTPITVHTDGRGAFFATLLQPGPGTATFPFEQGDVTVRFQIVAHERTFVRLTPTPVSSNALAVQVLDFADDRGAPVPDAYVTLQGVDGVPWFATTDASGVATFRAAPGPYTITAQTERLAGFSTVRSAWTLVGVSPGRNPRTIVVPINSAGPGAVGNSEDATLEGTVLNAPPGVDLEYQVAGGYSFGSGAVTSGMFSVDVTAEDPVQVAVTARDVATHAIVSVVFAAGLTAAEGETLRVDFDFHGAIPFDRTVDLAYTNARAHDRFYAQLLMGRLWFPLTGESSLPGHLGWPDLSKAELTAFDASFDVGSIKDTRPYELTSWHLPLHHSTPSGLDVRFIGPPTILEPADDASFESYGPGSTVRFQLGASNGSTAGYNSLLFSHSANGLASSWHVLVAPDATSFTLPPVFPGKPMFATGWVALDVSAERFDFPGFRYASFFDQNLPGNLAAVRAGTQYQASAEHFFAIASDPPAHEVHPRADVERQFSTAKQGLLR